MLPRWSLQQIKHFEKGWRRQPLRLLSPCAGSKKSNRCNCVGFLFHMVEVPGRINKRYFTNWNIPPEVACCFLSKNMRQLILEVSITWRYQLLVSQLGMQPQNIMRFVFCDFLSIALSLRWNTGAHTRSTHIQNQVTLPEGQQLRYCPSGKVSPCAWAGNFSKGMKECPKKECCCLFW